MCAAAAAAAAVLCSLVISKIEQVEAEGGVEAVARAVWGNEGIWGDMQVRGGEGGGWTG